MMNALTFWAPNLLNSLRVKEAEEALKTLSLPGLQSLLAKGDYFPVKQQNFYQQASFLFHQPNTLPIAATQASVDLDDADLNEFWLRVDPVQMIPDRDSLVLVSSRHLGIDRRESKALLESFNGHFKQDGVTLRWGKEDAWYLSIKQPIDIQTTCLETIDHHPVNEFYPTGNAAQYWRQMLNETQMLFFNHPVNEARRERGWPEINSVWVWGEGVFNLQDIHLRENAKIWSNHSYLKGMAEQTKAQQASPVESFQALMGASQVDGAENHFVVLDAVHERLESLQLSEWVELLQELETQWFEPMYDALKEGRIDSLLLDVGCPYRCHLKPIHTKRFWRFRKGLNKI